MSEVEALQWEKCIRDFLVSKAEVEIERYLKEIIKKIGESYKKENYFGDEGKKNFFDPKKSKKGAGQSSLEFLNAQLVEIEKWPEKPTSLDFVDIQQQINTKKLELSAKFEANRWLSWAAENARSVTFSTHVSKLTHSAIDSSSFYDGVYANSTDHVCTSSLKTPDVDGAVRGNQYAPIYQFLELSISGDKLAKLFANKECVILRPFAQSDEENANWNEGFGKSLKDTDLSAHTLLKQVYFPLKQGELEYHLLCNLVSSSIAQRIFTLTKKEENDVSKQLGKQKYIGQVSILHPNMASIAVTASNHGNASQLNGKRGGKLKLFSSQPPTWQTQLKPPIYKKSLFFEPSIYRQVKEDIDYLRDFLLRFETIDLSIKDPKRMQWIEKWVGNIVDEILFYIGSIHSLPSGWSDAHDIKLKPEHQYVLDPHRDDDDFQSAKTNTDWLTVVCKDFADWLNYKLAGKDRQFTPQAQHSRLWIKLLEPELREFMQTVEFDRKYSMEVEA